MSIAFDFDKMARLLENFYAISGIRYSLVDHNNNLLCSSDAFSDFCVQMNALPEGHRRCKQCDAEAVAAVARSEGGYYTYRCHAGLMETIIPIRGDGETLAHIMFGQMIGQGEREEQWRDTRGLLSWHGKAEKFRAPFLALKQIDEDNIRACAELLMACSSYLWMECFLRGSAPSDYAQLAEYIEENYAANPSLGEIAKALSMSKTKLCAVAAKEGATVKGLLGARQMKAAKKLLAGTDLPISEVAALSGVRDYNYFSKRFKQEYGVTPRDYRRAARAARQDAAAG